MPETLAEAVDALAELEGRAVPIAGGTDLLVHWPERLADRSATYLDLSKCEEMRAHVWSDDALVLGGLTTFWDIVRDKRARAELGLLVDAARTVGAVQIQSRGTWAGNIVNASPAADGVPALMALDATVELTSAGGTEQVRLDEFYLGYKQMRRRPDQLVTRISVPRWAYSVQRFVKVGSRRAQAITKVGVAVARSGEGWRVVANSMAPTVRRCPAIERMLEDQVPVSGPAGFEEAICSDLSPIGDIRSTEAYRRGVMARVLFHELSPICGWVGGEPE